MSNMSGKDFLLGAVVGAIVGAATALLLAPKSGKELRGDIGEQYRHVQQKTQEIASTVRAKGQAIVEKAKETALQVADDLKSWKQTRQEAAADAADEN